MGIMGVDPQDHGLTRRLAARDCDPQLRRRRSVGIDSQEVLDTHWDAWTRLISAECPLWAHNASHRRAQMIRSARLSLIAVLAVLDGAVTQGKPRHIRPAQSCSDWR